MPTPIQHLAIAEQILALPALPQGVRRWLEKSDAVQGAFFFGNIAPDVQVVSCQPRESTHFYTLPPSNHCMGYERLLSMHPALACPRALSAAHAAFLAGYIVHLVFDELWVREIFPAFGPGSGWKDWRERLLFHNVLRAWLDEPALVYLRDGMGALLRQAQPDDWLPFAIDADLCRWRDLVAEQFVPGASIRTVEVFADRAKISTDEFRRLLQSQVIQAHIFQHVSAAELETFHARAVTRSRDLLACYLKSCVVDESE